MQACCRPKVSINSCLQIKRKTVLQSIHVWWCTLQVRFEFPEPSELPSSSLLQLIDADFKYPGRDDFGLQGLNIGIDMGSRVAIVGPNGAGKTTLMNLLAGSSCSLFLPPPVPKPSGGGMTGGCILIEFLANEPSFRYCNVHHSECPGCAQADARPSQTCFAWAVGTLAD